MTLVGTTIGRIRIVETLGKGGMGEVYLGYDETLKRQVALKAIRDEQRPDAEAKARFLREARILSQLDHPGICRIYEFIEGRDSDFLVLELISGTSLRKALEEDGLDSKLKLYVAEMVAEALVAAHAKGVAHRDLKPENVMLTTEGEVKVLDFGLAFPVDERLAASMTMAAGRGREEPEGAAAGDVATDEITATALAVPDDLSSSHLDPESLPDLGTDSSPQLTRTVLAPSPEATRVPPPIPESGPLTSLVETERGVVMGTVAYMSPEQARGERVTVASDLYSFGLTLQELFTGRSAYPPGLKLVQQLLEAAEGKTLPVTGVDADLADLITHLKSPAPAARPTALATAERLRWIRDKPKRRLRRWTAAAAGALLLLAGLKYTVDLRNERQAAEEARIEADQVSDFLLAAESAEGGPPSFLHTHVLALLYLGRIDEARPKVAELLSLGWNRPEFLELCRRHGLL